MTRLSIHLLGQLQVPASHPPHSSLLVHPVRKTAAWMSRNAEDKVKMRCMRWPPGSYKSVYKEYRYRSGDSTATGQASSMIRRGGRGKRGRINLISGGYDLEKDGHKTGFPGRGWSPQVSEPAEQPAGTFRPCPVEHRAYDTGLIIDSLARGVIRELAPWLIDAMMPPVGVTGGMGSGLLQSGWHSCHIMTGIEGLG